MENTKESLTVVETDTLRIFLKTNTFYSLDMFHLVSNVILEYLLSGSKLFSNERLKTK